MIVRTGGGGLESQGSQGGEGGSGAGGARAAAGVCGGSGRAKEGPARRSGQASRGESRGHAGRRRHQTIRHLREGPSCLSGCCDPRAGACRSKLGRVLRRACVKSVRASQIAVAEVMKDHPGSKLNVRGRPDRADGGNADFQCRIAADRAEAVCDWLVAQGSISLSRLRTSYVPSAATVQRLTAAFASDALAAGVRSTADDEEGGDWHVRFNVIQEIRTDPLRQIFPLICHLSDQLIWRSRYQRQHRLRRKFARHQRRLDRDTGRRSVGAEQPPRDQDGDSRGAHVQLPELGYVQPGALRSEGPGGARLSGEPGKCRRRPAEGGWLWRGAAIQAAQLRAREQQAEPPQRVPGLLIREPLSHSYWY